MRRGGRKGGKAAARRPEKDRREKGRRQKDRGAKDIRRAKEDRRTEDRARPPNDEARALSLAGPEGPAPQRHKNPASCRAGPSGPANHDQINGSSSVSVEITGTSVGTAGGHAGA